MRWEILPLLDKAGEQCCLERFSSIQSTRTEVKSCQVFQQSDFSRNGACKIVVSFYDEILTLPDQKMVSVIGRYFSSTIYFQLFKYKINR